MVRKLAWSLIAVSLAFAVNGGIAIAGHRYAHRAKTYGQYGFKAYRYQHDSRRGSASVLAAADAEVEVNLVDSTGKREKTTKKRFHVPVSNLQADQVRLEKIGLAILSTGQAIFSGTLQHDGGADGSLRGNHVVIRVRAYTGVPRDSAFIDPLMVWERRHTTWVTRGRPNVVQFGCTDAQLQRFFQEITHLELDVEYIADR